MIPQPGKLVLLGHPVGHSLSPFMQNAALDAAGIRLRYEALDVLPEQLETALVELRQVRAAGNVTIPHKEAVFAACDRLTPLAARVGAVNVFWMEEGLLVGDNTDVGGFTCAVETLLGEAPTDIEVGLIGAGGAAAAVLAAVEQWPGSRAMVYNRSPWRAEALCERFGSVAQPIDDIERIGRAQLVVNATSIGLRDDAFPLDPDLVRRGSAVVDLVYRRGETAWVRALRAADSGRRVCDGLPMLVEQGALAFERWFGHSPDRRVMWSALP